jgi:hypothetical protein
MDVEREVDDFNVLSSQRRSMAALKVSEAMQTAAQTEARYRQKYQEAAAAFREKEAASPKLILSTKKHIASSPQMDHIQERARIELGELGDNVKNLQAREAQILLEIR